MQKDDILHCILYGISSKVYLKVNQSKSTHYADRMPPFRVLYHYILPYWIIVTNVLKHSSVVAG